MNNISPLEENRLHQPLRLPQILEDYPRLVTGEKIKLDPEIESFFPLTDGQPLILFKKGKERKSRPLRVGVAFSGGQAGGGHNVLIGLFEAIKKLSSDSQLFGFLGGPSGIINNVHSELTEEILQRYRNSGGFDLIGSGRTKIETEEHFIKTKETVQALHLDGLVIIGGDDSNTNGAFLAEYFLKEKIPTSVIGVPKTIDGDLRNHYLELPFGYDTATKTYSELIGNICRDALSAKKYYFFLKLMGRSASHITLECALQTHPNLALIGEEIEECKKSFSQVIGDICDLISQRARLKKNYGVILIPEGLIEFIPEFRHLTSELNLLDLSSAATGKEKVALAKTQLTPESQSLLSQLPSAIQEQFLIDRDPHGNVQVSKIETEHLIAHAVKKELAKRAGEGTYKAKFSAQPLFFGYEGRSAFPTDFDCHYCYALGFAAAYLIEGKHTGYLVAAQHLTQSVETWSLFGLPITSLFYLETRNNKKIPVVKKTLVDLKGKPFQFFKEKRDSWALEDEYRYPGPIQFFGPPAVRDGVPLTLHLERG